jgi:hypothetical protein
MQDNRQEHRFPWLRNNVLSLVAIFLAVGGGTAVAAAVVTDGADKAAKGKGKRGPRGPAGPAGPAGAPGSALAYAHINSAGAMEVARSKNIQSSGESGQPGYYCVVPSVPFNNFVVTADSASAPTRIATASFDDPLTSCAANAVVVTTTNTAGTLTSTGFWILFN